MVDQLQRHTGIETNVYLCSSMLCGIVFFCACIVLFQIVLVQLLSFEVYFSAMLIAMFYIFYIFAVFSMQD